MLRLLATYGPAALTASCVGVFGGLQPQQALAMDSESTAPVPKKRNGDMRNLTIEHSQ